MIERRKVPRGRVYYGGVVEFNEWKSTASCTVRNFSAHGAKVEMPFGTALPDKVGLTIWHRGEVFPATTVWRRGNEFGLAFDLHSETGNVIDLAKKRRLRGGVVRGFIADDTAGTALGYALIAGIGGLVAAGASYSVNTMVVAKMDAVIAALKRN